MKNIAFALVLCALIILAGCSAITPDRPLSDREEEIALIKHYKAELIDTLNPNSNETAVQRALYFCNNLLPDSMEHCYMDVATKIMPGQFNKSVDICNDEDAFEYNRGKNQALCFAELSQHKDAYDEMFDVCDLMDKTDRIPMCYIDIALMNINKTDAVRATMERCNQTGVYSENCLADFVEALSDRKIPGFEQEKFEMCMQTKSFKCLNETGTLDMAQMETIYPACRGDVQCLDLASRIMVGRGMLESALEICGTISSGIMFSPHDECVFRVASSMTDPEKITDACMMIDNRRIEAPWFSKYPDCMGRAARLFAEKGDLRAAQRELLMACQCSDDIIDILKAQDVNLALEACDRIGIAVDECKEQAVS